MIYHLSSNLWNLSSNWVPIAETKPQANPWHLKGFRLKAWPVHICRQGSCHLLILRGEHLLERFQLTHAMLVTSTAQRRTAGAAAGESCCWS